MSRKSFLFGYKNLDEESTAEITRLRSLHVSSNDISRQLNVSIISIWEIAEGREKAIQRLIRFHKTRAEHDYLESNPGSKIDNNLSKKLTLQSFERSVEQETFSLEEASLFVEIVARILNDFNFEDEAPGQHSR